MKAYFLAQMQLAPNEELVSEIRRCTGRPSFLLRRGVDTDFFSPQKRQRNGEGFTLGFVGRLRPEKNVRFFGEIDSAFRAAGIDNYRYLFVGDGSERNWLEHNLSNVEFTGEIRGEPLARAYANMDLFVFPSQTDAFGNVVLEAMSSGVPPIVMSKGGQKFLIEHDKNGFVVDEGEFVDSIVHIVRNSDRLCEMKRAARKFAEENSWDAIFGKTFAYYAQAMNFDKKIRV